MSGLKNGGDFDAVVIGAGFSGMGMLRRLRDEMGLSVQVYEAGSGVGGTWYWNRYPGARCDSESYTYCFTFSKELLQEWSWSGRYPEQPEILTYLNHVADRFNLRSNIQFDTKVTSATFLEDRNLWEIETDQGDRVTARHLITGIGCISTGNIPKIKGLDSFEGDWYHTGNWPHHPVDFSGKRVAVIGTGSSGVQSIPVIAEQAEHLTVFQRTPQFTVPARHASIDRKFIEEEVKPQYDAIVEREKWTRGGAPVAPEAGSALALTEEERNRVYEKFWAVGGTTSYMAPLTIFWATRKPTTLSPNSYAPRFGRRSRTPRPPRNFSHWTTLTDRSGLLWIPTTSRPTTGRTSIS